MRSGTESTLLAALRANHAFDPTPLRAQLDGTHIPFETMVAGSSFETKAGELLRAWGRVAVVGPSGSGKSSFIDHVVRHTPDLADIRVSVETEDPQVVTNPRAFAGHLIQEIGRQAGRAGRGPGGKRPLDAATQVTIEQHLGVRAGVGGSAWLAKGSLAADLSKVVSAGLQRSTADLLDTAEQAIAAITRAEHVPVVVVDDSDSWLQTELGDRSDLVGKFFGAVLSKVSRDLNVGLLVAVHEEYLDMPAYPRSDGFLTNEIALPRLPRPDALQRILAGRITAATGGAEVEAVFSDNAIRSLFKVYERRDGNLRRVMHVVTTALTGALDGQDDRIEEHHVLAALSQIGR